MTDIEWALSIVRAWKATYSMDTSIDMVRTFHSEVLNEAADRAAEWVVGNDGCSETSHDIDRLCSVILGDHAGKMTDLDPAVQDAVQKNFMELTGSNELLKGMGVVYKQTMERLSNWKPGDEQYQSCPTCAESVDGKPGNGACQQCREEDTHAADIETVREALIKLREMGDGFRSSRMIAYVEDARAALDRLEADHER